MGLEPTTSAVTGRHSNQLNHRANVRCLTGIYITIDLTFWQGFYAKKCNYFRFFSLNRATVLETVHQSLAQLPLRQRQLVNFAAFVAGEVLHKDELLRQLVVLQTLAQQLH